MVSHSCSCSWQKSHSTADSFPVKCTLFWLHLPVLQVNFVPTENDGDVFTDTARI